MSSVGGVGGAGGGSMASAGGVGPAGGALTSSGATPATSVGDGTGSTPSVDDSAGDSNNPEKLGAANQNISTNNLNVMSTQVTLSLRSISQPSQCQEPEMDLKKLIEMIIAIKLLQEMSKAMGNES